jgi:phage terminase large subunit-like protein
MKRSERNIRWCEEHLRIPDGKYVGKPLVMAEYMREDFRRIFDNPAGTRRAIISRGRKNAKTVETAMLMLLYLCGPEATPNSQLYSAAQSREQAGILFSLAAKMIRMSPDLSQYVTIRDTAKELMCGELGTKYRALSADASTAYGLSPRFIAHDELGQVRGPISSLYEALETATAAQDDPLSIIISTQAPKDSDLLSVLIEDAKKGKDPRTILRLDTAPKDLPTFSEEAIRAANPAFDIFMNKTEVLDMMAGAQRMPSRQAEFENLVLNRRVNLHNPFVTRSVWESNSYQPDMSRCRDYFIGLDLSSRNDLTALVLIGRDDDGYVHVKAEFFAPMEGVLDRSEKDREPYDVWARDGLITLTPGASVDYRYVAERLSELCNEFPVKLVAFDRWRIDVLKAELSRMGIELPLAPFGQGFKDCSPAVESLEALLLSGKIRHGSNAVLDMCAENTVVLTDSAANRKFDKAKATGRIDGMQALLMAVGVMSTLPHEVKRPLVMMTL